MEDGFIPKELIRPPLKRKVKSQNDKVTDNVKKDTDKDFKLKKVIVEKSEVRRNPKRQVGEKNYEEPEEPQDDRYIYCDFCEEVFVDDCSKCGQLSYLRDVEVPMGVENRAKLTVPKSILGIFPSPIHGFGVFARVPLKKGIKMGPYEGTITKVENTAGYSWKLRDGRLVDGADERFSNWMRFINCARHFLEQNLIAFQYKGNLYYRTCRDIAAGQELLVYYGQSFAENLGIDVQNYFNPKLEKMLENPEWCPHCNYAYKDLTKLKNHIALCKSNPANFKQVPDRVFSCRFCLLDVIDEEYLKTHETRCQKKRSGGVTKKAYSTLSEVGDKKIAEENGVKKKTDKIFECQVCSYSTNKKSHMTRHQRIHGKLFFFTCRICLKGFNDESILNEHMFHHLDIAEKTTILQSEKICDDYGTKITMEVILSGAKFKIVKYKCEKCIYERPHLSHFKDHIKTHKKVTTFICDSCECQSSDLEGVHLKECTQANEEECEKRIRKVYRYTDGHICRVCGYIASRRCDLKKHILGVHLRERNYKCDTCDFTVSQKGDLNRHILAVHLKKKDYKCSSCNYSASRKGDLNRHILAVHLKKKDYKCSSCNYEASQKGDLNKHILAVHLKKKDYKCLYCDYSTSRKGDLNRHCRTVHLKEKNHK